MSNNAPFNEGETTLYFFTCLNRKSSKNDSSNFKRNIGNIGTWREETKPVKIRDPLNRCLIGEKKTFKFRPLHTKKENDGYKWLMTEFSLAGTALRHRNPGVHYVICKIRKQQQKQNQEPTSSSTQEALESAVQPLLDVSDVAAEYNASSFGHQILTVGEHDSLHQNLLENLEGESSQETAAVKLLEEALKLLQKTMKLLEGKIGHKTVHKRAPDENQGVKKENPRMGKVTISKAVAELLGTSGHSDEAISGGDGVGKGMVDTIRDRNEGAAGGEAAHQHGRYGTVSSWMGKGLESHNWQGWKWRCWRGRSC